MLSSRHLDTSMNVSIYKVGKQAGKFFKITVDLDYFNMVFYYICTLIGSEINNNNKSLAFWPTFSYLMCIEF